jgi:aerobic carbon-monoxide dehydrogenase medium subunit
MISHRFEYVAPREMDEALDLLARSGDECAVLGGGTWLVPNMTFAVDCHGVVLDPKHLHLGSIVDLDDAVVIGARATYRDAIKSPVLSRHLPLLVSMASGITGGISIVGQGTIGGSACYANPSSDVPACLVALRARLRLSSVSGTREIEAVDFFTGSFATARRSDEMLTAIVVPKAPAGARYGYNKLKFSTGSWPIVTAAAVIEGERVRVVVGAASSVPVLTEAVLPANPPPDVLKSVASTCGQVSADEELADEFAGPGYRRRVAPSIVLRALERCGAAV